MTSVKLFIDSREPSDLREKFANAEIKTLDIGDFQIVNATDDRPMIIFERKTWSDFSSSMKNKRLTDQTARTVAFCRANDTRPILLLEHSQVLAWDTKETKFLDCSLAKYSIEGYSVVRTRDQKHTANIINWLKKRCEEGKIPSFSATLQFRGEAADICFSKSGNVTREKQWENMLTALRGVSKRRAKDICSQYPSAKHVIETFTLGKSLNVKGIGKKTEETIRHVLCG